MARFHVNTNTGESGKCKAKPGNCPLGGDSGEDNHYATQEEARQGAEEYMNQKFKDVYRGFRKGEREGMDMPDSMKRRLLKAAETGDVRADPAVIGRVLSKDKDELIRKNVVEKLNSQKLLRDMSDDESARVRKIIATKSNNREVLAKLANDPDAKVRYAAMNNAKTPVKARKAAQAAIREANLKNLEKARVMTKSTKE